MGRTHLKVAARGGEVLSFECGCGYRFSASTQEAQRLARKLHGSKCLLVGEGGAQNLDGPAIARHMSSRAAAVDAAVRDAKQTNKRAAS